MIVHGTGNQPTAGCYVNHLADDAYQWAERRRLETHPKTGAAQLVELRERIQEIAVPMYVETVQPKFRERVFHNISESTLLSYGVPGRMGVRGVGCERRRSSGDYGPSADRGRRSTLESCHYIRPPLPVTVAPGGDPFEHPDALRRFRVMKNVEELALALDYPWERWAVFLHPEQRKLVQKDFNGPARVSGTAGTGKTIVALHRAAHLARANPQARVLLTTFSEPLANALRAKLRLLISSEPRLGERIEIYSMDVIGLRLYELNIAKPHLGIRNRRERPPAKGLPVRWQP